MGLLPFAVSVHSFVTSVGNYAGFAAIVGLAVLVLLHFAQARETAGLREQAKESAQHVDELEARLAELTRARAAASEPQPAAAPVAARAPGRPPVAPTPGDGTARPSLPWAPAGVAAPALTAATRLVPAGPPVAATAPGSVTAEPPPGGTRQPTIVAAVPAAAGAGGGSNGAGHARAPVGARTAGTGGQPVPVRAATAEGQRGGSSRTAAATAQGAGQRYASRPAGVGRFVPPQPEPSRRSRGRVVAIVLGLLVAAAAVVAVLIATSTIGGKLSADKAASGAGLAHAGQARPVAVFNPASVTVAVLNGTGMPGLAGRTSHRLTVDGYRPGAVATASDQTQANTVVAYLPGYRSDAEHVAAALRLPATAVHQVNSTAEAVACPPPARCSANVVVTVGADLASS